jgi:hypothetical protein
MAMLASAVWLAAPSPTAEGALIGIDGRNGFDSNTRLATGSGFDTFRSTIASLGHTILSRTSFNVGDLVGLDGLIIKQPFSSAAGFTSSEIMAIQSFVSAGGGLLVIAEGGTGSESGLPSLNNLVAPYGGTFSSSVTSGTGLTITGFVSHPIRSGLTSIGVDSQRQLTISSPAIDLTTQSGDNDALAAVNGVPMSGNVVMLSDSSIWADAGSGSDRPITFGSNQLLLQNVTTFITTPIPEPGSLVLAGIGVVSIVGDGGRRRRRVLKCGTPPSTRHGGR